MSRIKLKVFFNSTLTLQNMQFGFNLDSKELNCIYIKKVKD